MDYSTNLLRRNFWSLPWGVLEVTHVNPAGLSVGKASTNKDTKSLLNKKMDFEKWELWIFFLDTFPHSSHIVTMSQDEADKAQTDQHCPQAHHTQLVRPDLLRVLYRYQARCIEVSREYFNVRGQHLNIRFNIIHFWFFLDFLFFYIFVVMFFIVFFTFKRLHFLEISAILGILLSLLCTSYLHINFIFVCWKC